MIRLFPFLFPAFFGTTDQAMLDQHGYLFEISFEYMEAGLRAEAVNETLEIINEKFSSLNLVAKNIDYKPQAGLILIDLPTIQDQDYYSAQDYREILNYMEGITIQDLWIPEDPEVTDMIECLDNNTLFKSLCNPIENRYPGAPFWFKIGFESSADIEEALVLCMDDPAAPKGIQVAWKKGESDQLSTSYKKEMYFVKAIDSNVPTGTELIENAWPEMDYNTGGWNVRIDFTEKGNSYFSTLTEVAAIDNRPIAIIINGEIYAAPKVMAQIDGGEASISGDFMKSEAEQLARLLLIDPGNYSYSVAFLRSY